MANGWFLSEQRDMGNVWVYGKKLPSGKRRPGGVDTAWTQRGRDMEVEGGLCVARLFPTPKCRCLIRRGKYHVWLLCSGLGCCFGKNVLCGDFAVHLECVLGAFWPVVLFDAFASCGSEPVLHGWCFNDGA